MSLSPENLAQEANRQEGQVRLKGILKDDVKGTRLQGRNVVLSTRDGNQIVLNGARDWVDKGQALHLLFDDQSVQLLLQAAATELDLMQIPKFESETLRALLEEAQQTQPKLLPSVSFVFNPQSSVASPIPWSDLTERAASVVSTPLAPVPVESEPVAPGPFTWRQVQARDLAMQASAPPGGQTLLQVQVALPQGMQMDSLHVAGSGGEDLEMAVSLRADGVYELTLPERVGAMTVWLMGTAASSGKSFCLRAVVDVRSPVHALTVSPLTEVAAVLLSDSATGVGAVAQPGQIAAINAAVASFLLHANDLDVTSPSVASTHDMAHRAFLQTVARECAQNKSLNEVLSDIAQMLPKSLGLAESSSKVELLAQASETPVEEEALNEKSGLLKVEVPQLPVPELRAQPVAIPLTVQILGLAPPLAPTPGPELRAQPVAIPLTVQILGLAPPLAPTPGPELRAQPVAIPLTVQILGLAPPLAPTPAPESVVVQAVRAVDPSP